MKFFTLPHSVYLMKRCLAAIFMCCTILQVMRAQSIHKEYKDGSIYVKLKNNVSAIRSANQKVNLEDAVFLASLRSKYGITEVEKPFFSLRTPELDRTYRVTFAAVSDVDALLAELSTDPTVEYAEKIPLDYITYTPNDPSFGSNQWYLKKINAEKAWDISKGDPKITVAIVDNAIDIDHPDLEGNAWINPNEIAGNGKDDDNNGYVDDINGWDVAGNDNNPQPTNSSMSHGTHCAGDAAATADNNTGIASIGFNVSIISVKTTSDAGSVTKIEKGYDGIAYAVAAGARVISCSWGGYTASQTNQNIITAAYNKGCIVLGGAGNDGKEEKFYPGAYENALCVAASDNADKKSGFSNFGEWVDVTSPGSSIYSTMPNGTYTSSSGTSMATPIAAGLCALMLSKNPGLSPKQVEDCLKFSCTNIDNSNSSFSGKIGAGRINAEAALKCVIGTSMNGAVAGNKTQLNIYPNPATDKLFIETDFKILDKATLTLFTALGEIVLIREISDSNDAQQGIDLSMLPTGIYMLQFHNGDKVEFKKLIKN